MALLNACNSHEPAAKPLTHDDLLKSVALDSSYDHTVLATVYRKLASGTALLPAEIDSFSKDLGTRASFYDLLEQHKQTNVFPGKYYNFNQAAEGILARWLAFPTELDTVPSEIAVMKKVVITEHDSTFTYYVLRYKSNYEDWAEQGWMMGIVGPYLKDSKPYDWSAGTFSRFKRVSETTPEEEVKWTHEHVFRRPVE